MTATPNPSGFRSINIPDRVNARLLANFLVSGDIDFNYTAWHNSGEMDCTHNFVYPVKHDRRVKELVELLK